ncbi:MAG: 2-nitropropane dioxygenase [delta proteobacterium ML8_F1]|nr:MAG: 2-nitropropane dioxygenase [delta proteobacterium ML8_F1]
MNLPVLTIGKVTAKVPIVQGGMGVGISLSSLAGHVALNGGIGVISGVEIGFKEPDYLKNKLAANHRALKRHIEEAKRISKNGVIGVNIMVAVNNFEEYVKTAVAAGADIIFSGAGLPLNLPLLTQGTDTSAVPIVSSGRTARVICKTWDKRFGLLPDAIVLEGPLAGGHLGFSLSDLENPEVTLENILGDVLEAIRPFEERYGRKIPVIAGGGISSGEAMGRIIALGATGVQVGTRFVATRECDASEAFKQSYLDAKPEDIALIESPVGMPGRAVMSPFLEQVFARTNPPFKCLANCLKPCDPKSAPYCIADALISAQEGNFSRGYAFAGAKAYEITRIQSVKEVMDELINGAKAFLENI